MHRQEKGKRKSCALPYELYADVQQNFNKITFEINMKAGNEVFRSSSAGTPILVYVPGSYTDENGTEDFQALEFLPQKRGDQLNYEWSASAFKNNQYNRRLGI